MKILFLTQVLPFPLDAGPKVRSYYTLRYLSRKNEVTLVSFVRSSDTAASIEHLRSICHSVHLVPINRTLLRDLGQFVASTLTGRSFLMRRDWYGTMADRISEVIAEEGPFESIHADQLSMAPYALFAKQVLPADAPPRMVLDQHNAMFQIPARMAEATGDPLRKALLRMESRRLASEEIRLCRRFDQVTFVAADDQKALSKKGLNIQPEAQRVVPLCVDPTRSPLNRDSSNAHRITFVGGLHWPPNAEGIIWFYKQVWPQIHSAIPRAVFTIIGPKPPECLLRDSSGMVETTGHRLHFDSLLEESAVTIVPLLAAGGVRVKILEAWSKGIPVVSTTIGAEGLRAEHGRNLLIADSPADFAEAVIRVSEDSELARALIAGGLQTIRTHYDWRSVYSAWDEVHQCESCSSSHMFPA